MRIFIGYDESETVAFHVLSHSIHRHASKPVSITPLMLNQLPLTRPRDPKQSTDFAFSRFLVPYLCDYEGMAVFMDCDMLCRADIWELADYATSTVCVVKHDYSTHAPVKFRDHANISYGRKNWSSVMLFNCEWCHSLTPEYVNSAPGLDLHQFRWLVDEGIGELPREWNHLVGEYKANPDAKLAHFTLGTPCFAKYRHCEFAEEWFQEKYRMLHYDNRGEFSKPERVDG
jgi:hypothetical protein